MDREVNDCRIEMMGKEKRGRAGMLRHPQEWSRNFGFETKVSGTKFGSGRPEMKERKKETGKERKKERGTKNFASGFQGGYSWKRSIYAIQTVERVSLDGFSARSGRGNGAGLRRWSGFHMQIYNGVSPSLSSKICNYFKNKPNNAEEPQHVVV